MSKMIYLDYSANYPVKKEVLEYLSEVELNNIGNVNSIHKLGENSSLTFSQIDSNIKKLLDVDDSHELVYTSSATEANNLAIKGIAESYSGFGKHILVSPYEHSSVNGALASLKDKGFEIEFLKVDKDGHIDLNQLEQDIKPSTILVITIFVEAETGLINDVSKISEIIKKHEHVHHLVDATQGIIKENLNLNELDLVTFTPHKFGGLTGTGVLVKNKSTILTPLINGGKSNSIYRSGSTPLGLIASIEKSIELAKQNVEKNNLYVKELHDYLINQISNFKEVLINKTESNYILNISIKNIRASRACVYLSEKGICVSQKSACSISNTPSKTIMSLYNDKNRALSSFRISLSELTSKSELDQLVSNIRSLINE